MGCSKFYPESEYPNWVEKPEGYQEGAKVRYDGNIFVAAFWASKPGEGNPNTNGWRLFDELYDITSGTSTESAKIIAYIPTWRKEEGFNYANQEMYENITHGIISFLMFDQENLGEFDKKSLDDISAIINDVRAGNVQKNAKILIALGGATDYGFFYLMDEIGKNPSSALLDQAVEKVVKFIEDENLDGVDLDLECWWSQDGNPGQDQGGRYSSADLVPPGSDGLVKPHPAGKGLTEFAKRLKQVLPSGKTVSAAVAATSWYGNNYDPGLADYVDWIGVMSYDLTGSWNTSPVGPHTELIKIRDQNVYESEQQLVPWDSSDNPILSVEESLWYWSNKYFTNWQGFGQQISRNKLALGVPLYGYDFAYGKDTDPLTGDKPPGYKVIQYKDILKEFPDAYTSQDANIQVLGDTPRPPFIATSGNYPFAHNIYFETPETAVKKLQFLNYVGAQGVIIWEISGDVWEENKSIIKALYRARTSRQDICADGSFNRKYERKSQSARGGLGLARSVRY